MNPYSETPRMTNLVRKIIQRAERKLSDRNGETRVMPLTVPMVASEILMCGLKNVPFAGAAFEVLDALRLQHQLLGQADRLAELERKRSDADRAERDRVARDMQTILEDLRLPNLSGPALTEEVGKLRQMQDQGWTPSLFEGLLANSWHREQLKRNPQMYGRLLGDHDLVDPSNGLHVLLDVDKTRILELSPFAFSHLLAHQARGIPEARIQASEGVWAFLKQEKAVLASPLTYWTSWNFPTAPQDGNRVSDPLEVPRDLHDAMVAHCLREAPLACVGILGGYPPRVSSFHPLRNVAASEDRYDADPRDLIDAAGALRARREEMLAIYHCRPREDAFPSLTDLRENYYGAMPRIIVSLLDKSPVVRVWRLDPDSYQELPWRLGPE